MDTNIVLLIAAVGLFLWQTFRGNQTPGAGIWPGTVSIEAILSQVLKLVQNLPHPPAQKAQIATQITTLLLGHSGLNQPPAPPPPPYPPTPPLG